MFCKIQVVHHTTISTSCKTGRFDNVSILLTGMMFHTLTATLLGVGSCEDEAPQLAAVPGLHKTGRSGDRAF